MRDHAQIAWAYAALGKDGVDAGKALMLYVAQDCDCADASLLSSATTAQELPLWYRALAGVGPAQWLRPVEAQNPRGVGGRYGTRAGADDPPDDQSTPSGCQEQPGKADS